MRGILFILIFTIILSKGESSDIFEELLRVVNDMNNKMDSLRVEVDRISNKVEENANQFEKLKVNAKTTSKEIQLFDPKLECIRLRPNTSEIEGNITSDSDCCSEWTKIFSHNIAGGLFSSLLDALNKNSENPKADLYSILDQLESYRTKNGFHFKLCYPELVGCNEWIQTSNPAKQFGKATGFKAIKLAYATAGDHGEWKGIGRNPINHRTTFIDDSPLTGYWWTAIGALALHEEKLPGPLNVGVNKVELYVKH